MNEKINGYKLSRNWFNYAFDNPEKIRPIHTAIYFFAIEHCNRLGWKEKFGFPTQMAMEAIGIKNWRTYNNALTDLVDWGFLDLIEKSKNQYSSCTIRLCKKGKSTVEALDKALSKHGQKQVNSTVVIDKQTNKEQTNKERNVSAIALDVPSASDSQTWEASCRIANRLLESICEYDPTHKYNYNPPSIEQWVKDIDLALRRDGRTEEQMNFIINAIFKHSDKFPDLWDKWAMNIESGGKLRSKFDQIKNQIKSDKNVRTNQSIDSIVDSLYQ
jgi:hypothetical protein